MRRTTEAHSDAKHGIGIRYRGIPADAEKSESMPEKNLPGRRGRQESWRELVGEIEGRKRRNDFMERPRKGDGTILWSTNRRRNELRHPQS